MGPIAKSVELARLLELLSSGGDERIVLDPVSGANRYHLDPLELGDLLQRGSCTCGALNPRSLALAQAFLASADGLELDRLAGAQADRLRALAHVSEGADVFFAPSGTDLTYWPLLFQALLHPGRPLLNLVSCPEELGSGTTNAAAGRYFSAMSQFGGSLAIGELVAEAIAPEVVSLAARSAAGEILERRGAIGEVVGQHPEAAIVGSLVFGSKSGITDDLDVIGTLEGDIAWVVDLCQLRVDPELVRELLERGAMVMLTGSKFFEAPPFAAALLVPSDLVDRLAEADPSPAAPYESLFSVHDVPPRLGRLRSLLREEGNLGLRLRWEIALDEMEAYAAWPIEESNRAIAKWNAGVVGRLAASPAFELMPDQARTNPSIVSFQVIGPDGELGHDELVALHRRVVTAVHPALPSGRRRVFLGQPVRYAERSFLRLAIGAPSVRGFLEAGAVDLADDLALIELLEAAVAGS